MEELTYSEIFEIKMALRVQATTMKGYGRMLDGSEWISSALRSIESAYEKMEEIERGKISGILT